MNKKKTYVIIRGGSTSRHGSGMSSIPVLGASSSNSLLLSTDELVPREAALLRRERSVMVVAKDMPTRLIEPSIHRGIGDDLKGEGCATTWGIRTVGAVTNPFTGTGVKIAVLDTGIEVEHRAFDGIEVSTKDFTGEADARDLNGHGTHCAGTIVGRDISGVRIGVARGVSQLLVGKVLGADGRGTAGAVLKAMSWAESEGAHLISISLGLDFATFVAQLEEDGYPKAAALSAALEAYRSNLKLFDVISDWFAARELLGHGSLVVAAAGNESGRDHPAPYTVFVTPPAVSERTLSVGALARSEAHASGLAVAPFSNAGVDVAAPGVDVRSAALGGHIASLSGTSMAAPHACGVAALWGEKLIKETGRIRPSELRSLVVGNARFPEDSDPIDVGRGLVYAPQE